MTEASDGKRTRQLYYYVLWLLCWGAKGAMKPRIAASSLHVDNLGSGNVRRHVPSRLNLALTESLGLVIRLLAGRPFPRIVSDKRLRKSKW